MGRYAVIKNPVTWYANINFLKERSNCHKKTQQISTNYLAKSNNSIKFFSRARFERAFLVIKTFIKLNIGFGTSKTRKSNKQTIQSKNECTYACNILSFYLLYPNEKANNGFVVKRYVVREAKKWQYEVRKAKLQTCIIATFIGGWMPDKTPAQKLTLTCNNLPKYDIV